MAGGVAGKAAGGLSAGGIGACDTPRAAPAFLHLLHQTAGKNALKATIWHNPRCSKSREALAILEATPGVEVTVRDYQKLPPSRAELAALYTRAGMTPAQGLRRSETIAKEQGLGAASDDAILDAMAAHPILIERPLVETDKGVRLGRPPETIREIL